MRLRRKSNQIQESQGRDALPLRLVRGARGQTPNEVQSFMEAVATSTKGSLGYSERQEAEVNKLVL